MVRRAAERLYDDTATITTFTNGDISATGKVTQTKTVHEAVPCRLSYKNLPIAGGEGVNEAQQTITLFINPDIEIKSGSEIVIVRNGKPLHFTASGLAALYQSHQEISLKYKAVRDG